MWERRAFIYLISIMSLTIGEEESVFRIKQVFRLPNTINARNYQQAIAAYIDTDSIVVYKAQEKYWKSLCYNGWVFGSSYCKDDLEVISVTKSKISNWVESLGCSTYEDKFGQWGSDSISCDQNLRTELVSTGNKEVVMRRENNHGLRYTCNQSWGCSLNEIQAPIRLTKSTATGNFIVSLLMSNGTLMELNPGLNFWTENGYSYLLNNTQHIRSKNTKLDCFVDREREVCLYKGTETVYTEGGNQTTCYGTVCIMPMGEGQIVYKPSAKNRKTSLSLESAYEILEELEFEKESMKYNLNLLQEELYRVGEITRELLYSAMKSDEHVLGRVIKHPIITKMLTVSTFKVYQSPHGSGDDTCVRGTNKISTQQTKRDSEFPDCAEFKELSISNNELLYFDNAETLKLYPPGKDYEIWREQKSDMEQLSKFLEREGYHYSESSLSDILSMPRGYINFILHGQLLTWIVLAAVCVLLLSLILKIRRVIFG